MTGPWSPRKVALLVAAVLVLGSVAAGCGGSALSPQEVRAANEGVAGQTTTTSQSTGTTTVDPGSTGTGPQSPTRSSGTGGGNPALSSGDLAHGLPGSSGGGTHSGPTGGSATGTGHKASCAGFHNQTGITNDTITIANASDISGPVPGIFTSAQQAVAAYVAYFNATSSLCGRKLKLESLDSRTNSGSDQEAYATACHDSFAAVGSMSAFDDGGAATAQHCGLPDIRSQAVTDARNACTTCFGAQATELHAFQNAVPDFFLAHYHAATQHAAMIYVNAAASVENAQGMERLETRRGMHFVYSAAFSVSEFNYTPYVQKMKQNGARWVQFVGSPDEAVRLAQAMQSASFDPDVYLLDPTAYNPDYVKSGGSAVNGSIVFINFTPFEEARSNKELQLYEAWLQQVDPGAQPTYFGLFAWSAARLFGQEAAALGGRLTRASLVDRIRHVTGWTDHGLHAPEAVGPKRNGDCWRFLQLQSGRWAPLGPRHYICHGSSRF